MGGAIHVPGKRAVSAWRALVQQAFPRLAAPTGQRVAAAAPWERGHLARMRAGWKPALGVDGLLAPITDRTQGMGGKGDKEITGQKYREVSTSVLISAIPSHPPIPLCMDET